MTKPQALWNLQNKVDRKEKRTVLSFDEYLDIAKNDPERVLRNIFQIFHDLVKSHVIRGKDDYPDDPESIGFIKYDCSKIFVDGSDNPFFADRLFANRFVRQTESLRRGSQQNRINVYEGPPGCGKSTFMNNILRVTEEYMDTKGGQSYEIFWNIDIDEKKVSVPCHSHDYPILIIPKKYRTEFLKDLLSDKPDFLEKLNAKEYGWVFKDDVCTVCKAIFRELFDKLGSLEKVLNMVRIRPYKFDRGLGEGISIFNPGDKPEEDSTFTDRFIQKRLDQIFGANSVKYLYSNLARTNNGIYVLMDIKDSNKARLLDLHNVISEGVHKVGDIEERVSSLFLALMNPEDKEVVKAIESFKERIQESKIRYVMEIPTEVEIYRNTFGSRIDKQFLPRVLENFARVIISTRMKTKCEPLIAWISYMKKYEKYCDEDGLLLRMGIYGGVIPQWLSDEDRKKFTEQVRRKLIAEGENEGDTGFTGRDSIRLFGDFYSMYAGKINLVNMANVTDFFKHKIDKKTRDHIPKNFIDSLVNWYDYAVLSEVKESLYLFSKEQITKDILEYLHAVNYDIGTKTKCRYTGEEFEVTVDFFRTIGTSFTGEAMSERDALNYAKEIQKKYVEMLQQQDVDITETELYKSLWSSYAKNLKEKALPFLKNNDSFKEAVKAYGTEAFKTFDTRQKEYIAYMIKKLVESFEYTEQGAKEVCLYVIEQKIADKFSK
ncbi:MAG: hypothetical protein UW30_C0013G0003 [Candidatus Giovannonibacteria bacterium GW2011_GWA2_44_13b]|uniref:PrkA AAA domain-containing protein n=2 Tax=Candidatus Giovannoniibacteriota TaxID=1752738 RepID=A0A0G1JZW6_9BACT|nr:MAG: hypothetical protein UW30_C0013G0003 [Candidatus Giovannonibacteria bacterium GW2011_GWA2_44_13b]OGF81983.1 MAG: hypothetical protein A2924_04675 [Candidatus Giovannonibacteria bacterium RIFCSPLOWO2_01_FULL_44_16]